MLRNGGAARIFLRETDLAPQLPGRLAAHASERDNTRHEPCAHWYDTMRPIFA